MSVKAEIKGQIVLVEDFKTVGDKNTRVQQIHFMQPARKDEYGEVVADEELWVLSIWGDRIEKLNLTSADELKKGMVTVFFSPYNGKTTEGKVFNNINVNVYKFDPK